MSDTSDLTQTAKQHAAELGQKAHDAATQEAVAHADSAKQKVTHKVQKAADAAGAAASELDPNSPQAQAMQQVADTIEDVAHKIRTTDIRHMADQATEMARRNPLLFIGGAAIAGFAAARFLKARAPHASAPLQGSDPWGSDFGDKEGSGHV
ncbi:MAG: hypothetical protein AAGK92_01670 [Pseudomonadota bacterium]